jgi:molybdate transport system regulatory protein
MARVRLRIYLADEHALGPGKVELLEAVREHGSISAAARSMEMAYRHAWVLIDAMNRCFGAPLVATATGGRAGGGAVLTALGEEVVRRFRSMEQRAGRLLAADLAALEARRDAGVRPRRSRTRPGSGRRSPSGR